jgi:hypothetical protein
MSLHNTNLSQPNKVSRPKGVPIKYYWKFLRSGNIFFYLLACKYTHYLVILTITAQTINVLSLWWIGAARSKYTNLSNRTVVAVYTGLLMGYGLLLFIGSIILPFLSKKVADKIAH